MDFIRDKKTNEEYVVLDELVPILNQQDHRIAELEKQLDNSIRPKFKIGQEVWIIINGEVVEVKIKIITFYYDCKYVFGYKFDRLWDIMPRWEDEIFATEEEAQAKLKELQGE
jgi:hypothetical protein